MADDYDLVPHEEIIKLRKEVEELKKNPLSETDSGKRLMGSINELTNGLTAMMELFKQASNEMKLEERESQIVAKKIEPLYDKLDELMETNEKIAKGILTVADMLKEFMHGQKEKRMAPRPIPVSRLDSSGQGFAPPSYQSPPPDNFMGGPPMQGPPRQGPPPRYDAPPMGSPQPPQFNPHGAGFDPAPEKLPPVMKGMPPMDKKGFFDKFKK